MTLKNIMSAVALSSLTSLITTAAFAQSAPQATTKAAAAQKGTQVGKTYIQENKEKVGPTPALPAAKASGVNSTATKAMALSTETPGKGSHGAGITANAPTDGDTLGKSERDNRPVTVKKSVNAQ